jgi:hypothetical protein
MRIWTTALSGRPSNWQSALTRVPGGNGKDTFQFGDKTIQCRLIGSDMLVIDGKNQILVERFLDQYGESLVSAPVAAPGPATSSDSQTTTAGAANEKKGGLRLQTLRKQPLGQTNDMETN